MSDALEPSGERLQHILVGKVISNVRQTDGELMIEFVGGDRLFVDVRDGRIELSVT